MGSIIRNGKINLDEFFTGSHAIVDSFLGSFKVNLDSFLLQSSL